MSNKYYPIYLDLEFRRCVVIGGNDEASRKVQGLIDSRAQITVISPDLVKSLQSLVEGKIITWLDRPYISGDLFGATLVIVADSGNMEINEQVFSEANSRNVLVNVSDKTPLCSFIAPAIAERGSLKIAVSTGGGSPALTRKVRDLVSHSGILDWGDLIPLLSKVRYELKIRGQNVSPDTWQKSITPELLKSLQNGHYERAYDRLLTDLICSKESNSKAEDS
jgi:precorrin-2 dehydrogenase/sirohydrochlorin ferrochelatase